MALSPEERREVVDSVTSVAGPHRVRWACAECGAHVFAQAGFQIVGQCGNCHSYKLVPLGA